MLVSRTYIKDSSDRPLAITYRKEGNRELLGTIILVKYNDANRDGKTNFLERSKSKIDEILRARLLYEIGIMENIAATAAGGKTDDGIDNMETGYKSLVRATGKLASEAFQQLYIRNVVNRLVDRKKIPFSQRHKEYAILVKERFEQLLAEAIVADEKKTRRR